MNSFCTNVVKQVARFYYYYHFLLFLYFYCSFRLAPPPPPKKKHFFTRSRLFCTFLCRCFARLRGETSQLHVLQRNCGMCSCSNFFYCCSVSPLWPLAFLIFSHPIRYENFHLFFRQNMSPLLFISRSTSFPVIHH